MNDTGKLIIGIDPGKSGGIAWCWDHQREPFTCKMPDTPQEVRDVLLELDCGKCYIEKVHAMPSQGVTSVFTFGRGLGVLEGVLATLCIPYEFVTPQKWQKAMGCMTGGDKNVSKAKALELWPRTKWTHAVADAALICEYGRRTENIERNQT